MNIKFILESLLFVNEKPIEVKELAVILGQDKKDVVKALEELSAEYAQRECGISIVKVAGGYQMCSHPDNAEWIKKMYREKNKQRLSGASLETIAIIAYKQPITRTEIEAIRGVNSDGVVHHLLSWGLIKEAGRKEVPGRPFLYITTRKFLEYFGLDSLKDLPCLEEFSEFTRELETGQDQGEEPEPVQEQGPSAQGRDCGNNVLLSPEEAEGQPRGPEPGEQNPDLPADIMPDRDEEGNGPDSNFEVEPAGDELITGQDFTEESGDATDKLINTEGQ